jgi:galactokinase
MRDAAQLPPSPPLRQAFRDAFGAAPEGVWAAPGRVNLIGEHTDYNDGLALPLGIAQRTRVAVRRRADQRLCLRSLQAGQHELSLAQLAPGQVSGWAAYVGGVAWAALQAGAAATGLDVLLDSDVPMGAGLSSSAALECACLLAMAELWGFERSRLELARLAQRAETEFAGVPCGLMDQLASLHARSGHALMVDFRALTIEPVPLPLDAAGLCLVVIDTRAPHELARGEYAERRRACASAASALGLASLRDASLPQLARLDPASVDARRARHVVRENARVSEAFGVLRQRRPLAALGPLLTASHASLRDDFEVTVPHLDVAAASAEAAGALGARMVGGGFGGSVIALCRKIDREGVAERVLRAFAERGWDAPRLFDAEPGDGASRLE